MSGSRQAEQLARGGGAEEGGAGAGMASGTVRWFDKEEGYGYVAPDKGGEDLFVHYTAIRGAGVRSLERGERVSYEPARGALGGVARYVRKIE
jgi:CspA family cold shock protein